MRLRNTLHDAKLLPHLATIVTMKVHTEWSLTQSKSMLRIYFQVWFPHFPVSVDTSTFYFLVSSSFRHSSHVQSKNAIWQGIVVLKRILTKFLR